MIRIETELFISAPPEKVWEVLMDFDNYPNWNPFVFYIEGEKIKGGKLEIKVNSPDGAAKVFDFTVYINAFEEDRFLAWAGKPLFPWLFSGVHYFRLEKAGDGTLFTHGETFSGIIAHLMKKKILQDFPKGYAAMNLALAKQAAD
jgi:hypothetical protein